MTDTPPTAPTPPAAPHGPLPGQQVRYGAVQIVAAHVLEDAPVVENLGKHLLRDLARNDKRVLVGEVVETKRIPVVLVHSESAGGPVAVEQGSVFDTTSRSTPEGYLLAWEADTTERVGDPDPVIGYVYPEGGSGVLYRGDLAEPDQARAGQVNFRHGIDGEAIIRAYTATGQKLGYLFAVEIQPGEHQVEVLPGTAYLTAEPDPAAQEDQ